MAGKGLEFDFHGSFVSKRRAVEKEKEIDKRFGGKRKAFIIEEGRGIGHRYYVVTKLKGKK